jgi:hypothetical protein
MHHRHGNQPHKFRDRPRVENTRRAHLTSAAPGSTIEAGPNPSPLAVCNPSRKFAPSLRRVTLHRERVDSARCVRRG